MSILNKNQYLTYNKILKANLFSAKREQWWYDFPNGLSASVVRGETTYGGSGLYEFSVMLDGECYYGTPISSDVIGWLTEEEANQLVNRVAFLEWDGKKWKEK